MFNKLKILLKRTLQQSKPNIFSAISLVIGVTLGAFVVSLLYSAKDDRWLSDNIVVWNAFPQVDNVIGVPYPENYSLLDGCLVYSKELSRPVYSICSNNNLQTIKHSEQVLQKLPSNARDSILEFAQPLGADKNTVGLFLATKARLEEARIKTLNQYWIDSEHFEQQLALAYEAASIPPLTDAEVSEAIERNATTFRAGNDAKRANETQNLIAAAREKFRSLPIFYNRPLTLKYNKPNPIVLSIGSESTRRALVTVEKGTGPVEHISVPLSNRVNISLSGPKDLVEIQLLGEQDAVGVEKDVSALANTSWTWLVTPKSFDPITLHLQIDNIVKIQEKSPIRAEVRASDIEFTVQATWIDRNKNGIGQLGIGLVTLFGLLYTVLQIHEMLEKRKQR